MIPRKASSGPARLAHLAREDQGGPIVVGSRKGATTGTAGLKEKVGICMQERPPDRWPQARATNDLQCDSLFKPPASFCRCFFSEVIWDRRIDYFAEIES
jgi:hypothetical protein